MHAPNWAGSFHAGNRSCAPHVTDKTRFQALVENESKDPVNGGWAVWEMAGCVETWANRTRQCGDKRVG